MKKSENSYQESIRYLFSLQKFGIKFGLSKTSNILEAFGNPHIGRKYIHIAGTNGKGSVAAFIASVLSEAGLKVGLYSSPHLVRFTERFRINGLEIEPEKAGRLIEELRAVFSPEEPPTYFEATTAMALIYFSREKTDIDIMEVGMGGRLDATNIITPLVCGITNISMEHQSFLGSSLTAIAAEKAGIIKKGVDVVTAADQACVINLFESICREKEVPLRRIGKDVRYRSTGAGLHYYGINQKFNRLELGLKGQFQARNAALALAIIEILIQKGLEVSSPHIRQGLKKASWPGRMQVMSEGPKIVLDGAHNPAAMRALAHCLRKEFNYQKLILVVGVMKDKDIGPLLRAIVPSSDYVFYTRPIYPRAAEPEILMAKASLLDKPGETVPTLKGALELARKIAGPEDLILVSGSLFTVGEALAHLNPDLYRPDDL